MMYDYTELENALEYAAQRLPVNILGRLIAEVEMTIDTRENSKKLTTKIYDMVRDHTNQNHKPVFTLTKLEQEQSKVAA